MLKSMTGFGRGEYADGAHGFTVEIKAVNHRYNDIVIRMPKNLNSLEDRIRRSVSGALRRGRIEVFISAAEFGGRRRAVKLDRELAAAYDRAFRELAETVGRPLGDAMEYLTRQPDIFRVEEEPADAELLWKKLAPAIEGATAKLLAMREAEGAHLERDLASRLDGLAAGVRRVEKRAPQAAGEYQARLSQRLRDLLAGAGAAPDEARVLEEAAIFAERANFTEEAVRLHSHLRQFRQTMAAGGAVGRKLDFIVQEMNREANTIAAKAGDADVINAMVEIKSEIEKIREQIQNIE